MFADKNKTLFIAFDPVVTRSGVGLGGGGVRFSSMTVLWQIAIGNASWGPSVSV